MRSTGFYGDVQASLMDIPFDGSWLFGDKADSALEHFKDSKATACFIGLCVAARQPPRSFAFFLGFHYLHLSLALKSPQPFRGRGHGFHSSCCQ